MEQTTISTEIQNKLAEADLYKTHGLLKEAAEVYKDLLTKIDPKEELYAKVTAILNSLTTPDKGLSEFTSGQPQHEKTLSPREQAQHSYESSLGLMEAGFFAEAIDELKKLLNSSISPRLINAKLGECYLTLDNCFDAIPYLEKARDAGDAGKGKEDLEVLDRLALAYENAGDFSAAISTLELIVKVNPKFRYAQLRLKNLTSTAQKFGRFGGLILQKLISVADLEKARSHAKQKNKSVDVILVEDFDISKANLGQSLSNYYKCPFIEFNELETLVTPSCIQGIKEHFFRANTCVPIASKGDGLLIASDNPFDMVKTDNIRSIFKSTDFQFAVALKEDIDRFIDYFYGKYTVEEANREDVFDRLELVEDTAEEAREEDLSRDAEGVVVQMTNKIIEDAIKSGSSDIHIETLPGQKGSTIRFRVDGECMHYKNIPYQYKRALISRIKILSKLDISERRLPQDGKIKFKTLSRKTIELRVVTMPTASGYEDAVLRILTDTKAMPLGKMGFLPHNLDRMKTILNMPYGLVLVVGPTGSGKTTTLHAALNYINTPTKKIWTVEDPVEILQDGLRQIQVQGNINLTFARVLKSFLRADPDIIMVGETRDEETAKTVIEASLTGHLVLSTLHTNSAPETITRLLGMGIDSYSFADSILGIIAQRLVRKICPACRRPTFLDNNEKEIVIEEFGHHPLKSISLNDFDEATIFSSAGCSQCKNSGYKGRFAIHEVLFVTDEIKKLIEQKRPVTEIREEALRGGMFTLKQDGIQKVFMGETDFRQIRAACIR